MSDERPSGFKEVEEGPTASDDTHEDRPTAVDVVDEQSHPTVTAARTRFGDAIFRHEVMAGDEHVIFVDPERNYEILEWLKDDPDQLYNFLSDVTAVDYGSGRPIQVVYQLYSIPLRHSIRVKAELPLSHLEIDSVVPLWKAANWLEREVYDMFGVTFRNHPDLRRILMPEVYAEGHPLRKDFPLRGRFSRAEQTRRALAQAPEDYYIAKDFGPGREFQKVGWQELGAEPEPAATPEPEDPADESEHSTDPDERA